MFGRETPGIAVEGGGAFCRPLPFGGFATVGVNTGISCTTRVASSRLVDACSNPNRWRYSSSGSNPRSMALVSNCVRRSRSSWVSASSGAGSAIGKLSGARGRRARTAPAPAP